MDSIVDLFHQLHSSEGLKQLVLSGGIFLLFLIIFAETGLLVGFFLPGDSLLITAGVVWAQTNHDPIQMVYLNLILMIAAVVGDQVGYWLGLKTGSMVFNREDSFFFKKKYVREAHLFYEKHGGGAIVLARFVPILRTFVPFIAGVATMSYRRFAFFNVFGGILWVTSILWIGYGIGQTPFAKNLHFILILVIFVSLLPILISLLKRIFQKSASPL